MSIWLETTLSHVHWIAFSKCRRQGLWQLFCVTIYNIQRTPLPHSSIYIHATEMKITIISFRLFLFSFCLHLFSSSICSKSSFTHLYMSTHYACTSYTLSYAHKWCTCTLCARILATSVCKTVAMAKWRHSIQARRHCTRLHQIESVFVCIVNMYRYIGCCISKMDIFVQIENALQSNNQHVASHYNN